MLSVTIRAKKSEKSDRLIKKNCKGNMLGVYFTRLKV